MATDPAELIDHVKDADVIHLPAGWSGSFPSHSSHGLAAALDEVHALGSGRRTVDDRVSCRWPGASPGGRSKGPLWNMIELIVLFIRDQVARPAIGRHDADRFLPFLWTLFFFILFLNSDRLGSLGRVADGGLRRHRRRWRQSTFFVVVGAGIEVRLRGDSGRPGPAHGRSLLLSGRFCGRCFSSSKSVGLLVRHFVLAVRFLPTCLPGTSCWR